MSRDTSVAHSLEHELTSIQCAFVVNTLFRIFSHSIYPKGTLTQEKMVFIERLRANNDIPESHPHKTQLDELIRYVESL